MIRSVELINIKCFPQATFELSPLTVFCGANSAGKSTVIQCLLLLKQSFDTHSLLDKKINLSGNLFSVGHIRDLFSQNPVGSTISIKIDDVDFISTPLNTINPKSYTLPLDNELIEIHPFFESPFHYLNAYRLAPQNSYDVNLNSEKVDFGIYGQFTISELQRRRFEPALNKNLSNVTIRLTRNNTDEIELENAVINESENINNYHVESDSEEDTVKQYLDARRSNKNEIKKTNEHDEDDNFTLEFAVKETMKRICKGFDIKLEEHLELDKVSNGFLSKETNYAVRPINTGFGISYVLPIVVAALSTPPGGILIVENPEVHLHPAAQAELAQFLGYASQSGIQVIIETHSDHIINGLRVFGKDNDLEDGHITINNIRVIEGIRKITPIKILKNGDLSDYETGFFDQAEKDLMRLFE